MLIEQSDYLIYFDNVRVDPYVINWKTSLGLFADGATGTVTMLKTPALDKLKLYLYQVRVFGKNPFSGKFCMLFEGEIINKSWNESRGYLGLVTFNIKGFYHWLDIAVPLNISKEDSYVNATRFQYEAQNINSQQAYEMFNLQKDTLLKDKSVQEFIAALFDIIHKSYYDIGKGDTTFDFTGLKNRFKVMGDIDKVFRAAGMLDGVTFSQATKIDTFYTYLNELLSQIAFEFYQDRDGTFKIKPPSWKDDILKTHVLDESIVSSSSYYNNWEEEPTRVLVQGGTSEAMASSLRAGADVGTQVVASVPMGLYIGTPEKGKYVSQFIEAKIYGKQMVGGSGSADGGGGEAGSIDNGNWTPPSGVNFNMKYPISTKYLTAPSKRRPGTKLGQVKFIVAHDVGSPESFAPQNINYYENSRNQDFASAHMFVDWQNILECVPAITGTPETANHVRDSQKAIQLYGVQPNSNAIGVEFCYSLKGTGNNEEAYKRYVWVLAYLCYHFKLNPATSITSHQILDPARRVDPGDALGKIGKSYAMLLKDVVAEYNACIGKVGNSTVPSGSLMERFGPKPLKTTQDVIQIPQLKGLQAPMQPKIAALSPSIQPRIAASPRAFGPPTKAQVNDGGSLKAAMDSGGWADNILCTSYYAADDPLQGGFSTAVGFSIRGTILYKGYRIIAVDPKYIPLYSIVEIEQVGDVHPAAPAKFLAVALDTGGAIKVKHIDLLSKDHDTAYGWGKRTVRMRMIQRGSGVRSQGKDVKPIDGHVTGDAAYPGGDSGGGGGMSPTDGGHLVQSYPTELPEFKSNYEPTLSEEERKYKMNLRIAEQLLIRNDLKNVNDGVNTVDTMMERYAKYIMHLSRANAHTINVGLTTLNPAIRPGFNAWLEPTRENIVFYVTGVTHEGEFQKGVKTNVSGGYLRSPESYNDIEDSVMLGETTAKASDFGEVVQKGDMNKLREKLKQMHDNHNNVVMIASDSKELRDLYKNDKAPKEDISTVWNKDLTKDEIEKIINNHVKSGTSSVAERVKELEKALDASLEDYARFLLMQRD
jgi:3D (Asp-Asp-Asp) domain-containing protein